MIELTISGMNCGGCASSVTRVVKTVDADATVDIDLSVKRVRIGSTKSAEDFRRGLAGAGFPAEPALSE